MIFDAIIGGHQGNEHIHRLQNFPPAHPPFLYGKNTDLESHSLNKPFRVQHRIVSCKHYGVREISGTGTMCFPHLSPLWIKHRPPWGQTCLKSCKRAATCFSSWRSPYWVDECPLKTHACPEPVTVTFFGKRIFVDVIKLRGGHGRSGRGWIQWLMYLWEDGSLDGDIDRRRLCKGTHRNGNHAAANRGAQKSPRSPQKLEEAGRLPLEQPAESSPPRLDPRLLASRTDQQFQDLGPPSTRKWTQFQ